MEQELAGFDRRDSEDQARIREVQAAIGKAESDAAALRRQAQEKLAGQTDLNDATDRLAETVSRRKAAQRRCCRRDAALRGAEDLRRVQAGYGRRPCRPRPAGRPLPVRTMNRRRRTSPPARPISTT